MKYGRSLSFCVRDILNGEVKLEDVGAIVTSTLMRNEKDLKQVFDSYMESYWSEYSTNKTIEFNNLTIRIRSNSKYSKGDVWKIVKKLWDEGKIYQPRLNKNVCQALYKYPIWCDSFEEAYESLEEI